MAKKARIRQVDVDIISEKDGSFAIACSALGVYAVGNTVSEAKKDFLEALDLHLSALRENAIRSLSAKYKQAGRLPWASSAQ